MTDAISQDIGSDFEFTENHFRQIAKLAHERYGLSLTETKKPLVYSRLARRLRARGINNFDMYLNLVAKNAEPAEETAFITALTTNVTSFYREKHHFDLLQERGVPQMIKRLESEGRARIWSAGCSTGEEPYSIALTLLKALPDAARSDVKILATDIDPTVVERARKGAYTLESAASIPEQQRKSQMSACLGNPEMVTIGNAARDMVHFAELNLMSDWPFQGPFDVIFCRNVAIYFDKLTQARLWQRFADLLTDGGLLFIGHSERVAGPAERTLSSIGITAYTKKTIAA